MPMVTFEATDEEKRVIEKMAKKEGVTISQYVRGCVFFDMLLSGDLEALKFISRIVRDKGARYFERFRQSRSRLLAE